MELALVSVILRGESCRLYISSGSSSVGKYKARKADDIYRSHQFSTIFLLLFFTIPRKMVLIMKNSILKLQFVVWSDGWRGKKHETPSLASVQGVPMCGCVYTWKCVQTQNQEKSSAECHENREKKECIWYGKTCVHICWHTVIYILFQVSRHKKWNGLCSQIFMF